MTIGLPMVGPKPGGLGSIKSAYFPRCVYFHTLYISTLCIFVSHHLIQPITYQGYQPWFWHAVKGKLFKSQIKMSLRKEQVNCTRKHWTRVELHILGWAYLIFVTGITGGACGDFFVMWRNFSTWQIVMWKKLSTWEMWRKYVMWRNYVHNLCFFCRIKLLWNHFFCDLRYFVENFLSQFMRFCVEKIKPKIVSVEKKGQISCMHTYTKHAKDMKFLRC